MKMTNETALRHWRAIETLDARAVKRAVKTIRILRALDAPWDLQPEKDDLCYWWKKRHESRREVRALLLGGAL